MIFPSLGKADQIFKNKIPKEKKRTQRVCQTNIRANTALSVFLAQFPSLPCHLDFGLVVPEDLDESYHQLTPQLAMNLSPYFIESPIPRHFVQLTIADVEARAAEGTVNECFDALTGM